MSPKPKKPPGDSHVSLGRRVVQLTQSPDWTLRHARSVHTYPLIGPNLPEADFWLQ
jgi:hypothetical protein